MHQGHFRIYADIPVRDGLRDVLESTLARAGEQVHAARNEPERAVHEYRKSLRRSRALVKLLAPALARGTRRRLHRRFREALRGTGAVRDCDVIPATLKKVAPDVSEQVMLAVKRALEARRSGYLPGCVPGAAPGPAPAARTRVPDDAESRERTLAPGAATTESSPSSSSVSQLLASCACTLPALAELIDESEEGIGEATMRRGFRRTYARARKAWRKVRARASSSRIHEWRKRVKELRYQVELISRRGALLPCRPVLAELAEELGDYTDREVLRRFLKDARASLAEVDVEPLTRAIAQQERTLIAQVLRRARSLFEPRPNEFLATLEPALADRPSAA